MADIVKQILAKPIQLADQVSKAADEASSCFKHECAELKSKTDKLAGLLRQAARSSSDLYERPTRRVIDDTGQTLDKALSLMQKCRANGLLKRVFTIVPAAAFRKTSSQLDNSIGDLYWLLRLSAPIKGQGDEYLGLPPIAVNEPILCLIWEQIAVLSTGSLEDRYDAAGSLVSLARDNERYKKLIIEEGGVGPLLKLIKEGPVECQENALRAIGFLGRDPESVEHMIRAGVCSVFAKILKEGPMKVQAVVAWAVSELAANYPKCQDIFAQHHIVRFLVSHLAFETVQEHSKYNIGNIKAASVHAAMMASNESVAKNTKKEIVVDEKESQNQIPRPLGNKTLNQMHNVVTETMSIKVFTKRGHIQQSHSHSETSIKGRDLEDPATKANMKAMAARALCHLAKGNTAICRSITESRAILCFAHLLEKEREDVRYNSAVALMEITAVAEKDAQLRKPAFKPNSPACKALIDQLINIIEKGDSNLLLPCIQTIGNLARTFRATEKRVIAPLVQLLDGKEAKVAREASVALTKFCCTDNYLHLDHSKAIISAGGAKDLVQLVYFGEQVVQIPTLVLLCYIALHVPDSVELAHAEVLTVLEWSSKQPHMTKDETTDALLLEAKSRLELYQSRGSRVVTLIKPRSKVATN